MYLRTIGRRFTQMIAYFLVMNSKRCILGSLRKRAAERRCRQNVCVRQTREGYHWRVLSWSSLPILCSELLRNWDVFRTRWSLAENFFNKIIVRLSFGFLLRKFTISELTIFFGCAHKGFTRQRWTRNSNYRTAGARTKFKTYLLKTNFCVLFPHWYRTTEELTSLSFWD